MDPFLSSKLYTSVADGMEGDNKFSLLGTSLTRRQMYVKALEEKPLAQAYNNLANILGPDETVVIGGQKYGALDLYIKAIDTNMSIIEPYINLHTSLLALHEIEHDLDDPVLGGVYASRGKKVTMPRSGPGPPASDLTASDFYRFALSVDPERLGGRPFGALLFCETLM